MENSNVNKRITTNQLAEMLGCKPDTARKSLCLKGHYLGIKPVKLPNGRLMWPEDKAEAILHGEEIA